MRLPARRSLRGWILSLVLLTTGLSLLIASLAMVGQDLQRYRRNASLDLTTQANIIALSSASALLFDDRAVAERNLQALRVRPDVLCAALYRADGRLYADFLRTGATPPPARWTSDADALRILGDHIELSRPVVQNGEHIGTVYLQGRYNLWGQAGTYAGISLLVILCGLGVALTLSQALQRAVTVPLEDLAQVSAQIRRQQDYSQRARGGGPNEINVVVSAFNDMLDEVQMRTQALESSNRTLQQEVQTRQAAQAALERANAALENAMAALRETDRRKDEFLATLAHELRNPLAPIRHAVKLLELPSIGETQRAWGREVIDRQTERMALLLEDLLDISRITRGRLPLKKQPAALTAIVVSALEAARPLIDTKRQQLQVELPPEPLELDADALRLSQAVSNLLINAAKYTDERGHIRLTAQLLPDRLDIAVSDDGIGLSKEALPTVFEMFSQVDTALDRVQGGLGIGLALVKGLVGLHGGSVEVQSAGRGCGSTFTIHLPRDILRIAPGSLPVPLTATPPKSGGCRVLIADDNRDAADSLAMLIAATGGHISVAYSGTEAWELATQWHPEVLVLDIGMPGLNGYELARRVRRQSWGSQALLIASSGWGQRDDKERALQAGFDRHFTKPVNPDELLELIGEFAFDKKGQRVSGAPARSV
jgi:two-component system, sensor histidine kinase